MGQAVGRKTAERRAHAAKKTGRKPTAVVGAIETSNGAGAVAAVPAPPKDPVDMGDLLAREVGTITIWDPRADVMGEARRDTGIRVEVSAIFSEEGRKAIEETRSRLTFVGGEVKPEDPALTDTVLEQVIAVTRRWWHVGKPVEGLLVNGEYIACTPENVRKMFTTPGWGWFYAAIREGWLEVSNFFGSPQKTA